MDSLGEHNCAAMGKTLWDAGKMSHADRTKAIKEEMPLFIMGTVWQLNWVICPKIRWVSHENVCWVIKQWVIGKSVKNKGEMLQVVSNRIFFNSYCLLSFIGIQSNPSSISLSTSSLRNARLEPLYEFLPQQLYHSPNSHALQMDILCIRIIDFVLREWLQILMWCAILMYHDVN